MTKLIKLEELLYTINGEIPLSLDVDSPSWTPDYKEGYVDGLKRALELIEELEEIRPLGDPNHDCPNCFKNNPDLPL